MSTATYAADVKVQLSIEGGKNHFSTGEPIILALTFTARLHVEVTANDTQWPFVVDSIVLSSTQGVVPWYDDEIRGHPFASDGRAIQTLQPTQNVSVRLSVNDFYRLEQTGSYRVHVVTNRAGSELTTNEVEFSFTSLPRARGALAVSCWNGKSGTQMTRSTLPSSFKD